MKKEKRYRHRQYLRKAPARATLLLGRNFNLGIEPDPKTALLVGELVGHLRAFVARAGVVLPIAPDAEFTQVMQLVKTMKRETVSRYRFACRPRGKRNDLAAWPPRGHGPDGASPPVEWGSCYQDVETVFSPSKRRLEHASNQ
jgi:hypothetical protein